VLVLFVVLGQVVVAQGAAVVAVTLTDAEGWPVTGVEVVFAYESGQVGGSCVTDGAGYCEIVLEDAPAGLIRGHLVVGEAGRRSLIWPGGMVEVPLQLRSDGSLYVATESIGGEQSSGAGGTVGEMGETEEVSPAQEFPTLPPPEPTTALPIVEPTASPVSAATTVATGEAEETVGGVRETETSTPDPVTEAMETKRNPVGVGAIVGVLVVLGLGLVIWGMVQGWRQRK